jgi:hypothetical protein
MQDGASENPSPELLCGLLELSSACVTMSIDFMDAIDFLSADERRAWMAGPQQGAGKGSKANCNPPAANLYQSHAQLFEVAQVNGLATSVVLQRKMNRTALLGGAMQVRSTPDWYGYDCCASARDAPVTDVCCKLLHGRLQKCACAPTIRKKRDDGVEQHIR